jgi:hypothetical protein
VCALRRAWSPLESLSRRLILEPTLAGLDLKEAETDMKTSDYQKLRNSISDLQYFGILLDEESKIYQRRLDDLWHGTDRKEQPVTENGQVASTEAREREELAETIRKEQRITKSGKSLALVDIPGTYEGRSPTNKARFSRLLEIITGKKLE